MDILYQNKIMNLTLVQQDFYIKNWMKRFKQIPLLTLGNWSQFWAEALNPADMGLHFLRLITEVRFDPSSLDPVSIKTMSFMAALLVGSAEYNFVWKIQ